MSPPFLFGRELGIMYVDFVKICNRTYKDLLLAEYRIVKRLQDKIRKRAE